MNEDKFTLLPSQEASFAAHIYHDNVAALNLGESDTKDATKKPRLPLSGSEKIGKIYSSV